MALQAAGKCLPRRSRTSGAKVGSENEPVIAAVNRCAPKIAAPPKIKSTSTLSAGCSAVQLRIPAIRVASGFEQFPPQSNSVRDEMPRGAFADVHGQHSSKGTGTRLEYLHGALSQTAVSGHKQHHASHQCWATDEPSMTFLIASQVSARQAIAEQRGLPKREAKAFSGDGVHSARGVAYQHGSATVHAPQSSGDGDRASFAGSEFGIFEACAEFREFS
jgi:hypothetical protein